MHPYTKVLMSSMPSWDPTNRKLGKVSVTGEPPSPINPPLDAHFTLDVHIKWTFVIR